MYNYTNLSLTVLIDKITNARFWDLPKMVAEALKKLQATPSYEPPYKVYTALLTQSGTDAPVATVLENTLGTTVAWGYNNAGVYIATLGLPLLTVDNHTVIQGAGNQSSLVSVWSYFQNNSQLIFETYDLGNINTTIALSDGLLINQFIEIRVYN